MTELASTKINRYFNKKKNPKQWEPILLFSPHWRTVIMFKKHPKNQQKLYMALIFMYCPEKEYISFNHI